MVVVVDTFEVQNNKKTEEQLKKGKVNYEVHSLTKGGDYLIEGNAANIVIERKEINDLFSSNHSGRLVKQMEKLRFEYPDHKKILLIEGNITSVVNRSMNRSKFSKTATVVNYPKNQFAILAKYSAEFVGIVNSIITTSEINIIQVASKWQTIILLKNLDEWANGDRKSGMKVSSEVKKVNRTADREVIDMILAIKGVGWIKAKSILKEYPSISKLVNYIENHTDAEIYKEFGENFGKHLIEVFRTEVTISDNM